jgi:hypothetical protein
MTLDTLQLGKELISLLTILTPFSVLPVYVSLTAGMPDAARKRALFKTLGTVLATLLFFQWTGMYLFRMLGVELPSFQIAGGLLSRPWPGRCCTPIRRASRPRALRMKKALRRKTSRLCRWPSRCCPDRVRSPP